MADPAPSTVETDIAAFLAENPDAVHGEPDEPSAPEPAGDDEQDSAELAGDGDAADAPEPADDSPEAPAPKPASFDVAALKKAIEADDPAAFVAALGGKAEALLQGKAHTALRKQVKAANDAAAKAVSAQSKADELAKRLSDKYGDPISARKAAETGDVDSFITLVERWSGHSWNDTMRWATAGMAGRKERLEAKAREANETTVRESAKREQAQAEVRDWCDKGVKKLAPELHSPEIVELVVAEIKAGFANGVTTPAKALPLVRKKLEAQYQRLHKVFGKGGKAPAQRRPAPATKAASAVGTKTRELSLEEEIASFKREQGLR